LTRFAWLSIAAATATIALKLGAYFFTGSVALLSDALESIVNLVAACTALAMLTIAARPPDETHAYGHSKAEYFSSGIEGALILLAAFAIAWNAIPRLIHPESLQKIGIGLAISAVATAINFVVARTLLQAGRKHRSISLEADAQHIMTDVWTSIVVLVGIAGVALTGWERLDPILALLVAANIIWTGVQLMRRSALGLMDTALPAEDQSAITEVLHQFRLQGIHSHALRTRQAGTRKFVSLHILVPGEWQVQRGHEMLEKVESAIQAAVPGVHVFTHLEPLNDPAAFRDIELR